MAEAGRIANLKGVMADGKSRNILLAVAATAVIGFAFVKIGLGGKSERSPELSGAAIQAPPTMTATPSGSNITSEKYARLLDQSNTENARTAEATGKSSIPVPGNLATDKQVDTNKLVTQAPNINTVPQPVVVTPPSSRDIPGDAKSQMDGLMERWSPKPQAIVTTGYERAKPAASESAVKGLSASATPADTAPLTDISGTVLVQAGSVLYGVLDTAINTDEPGPVLSTIVSGAMKGSKLLGEVKRESGKVVLKFTSIAFAGKTLQTNAFAIDPETARTAIASDVDNHYLERYGVLAASALLKGYSAALQRAGATTTISAIGATTTYANFDPKRQTMTALGEVGNAIGQSTQGNFNRPPTVTVNANTPIGVLFVADLVSK